MNQLFKTFQRETFKKRYIFIVLLVTILYISFAAYSINYRFVFSTITGNYPLSYKIAILFNLTEGLKTALSDSDFFLLLMTAILTGINVVLIIRTIHYLRNGNRVKFAVGGGILFGFVSTGCTSCGFSLLSVLGLGAVLGFLPLGSHTLYIFSIGPLLFSGFYMLKKLHDEESCKLPY